MSYASHASHASQTSRAFTPSTHIARAACFGVALALTSLAACQQQEISRTEKGYTVPSFKSPNSSPTPSKASSSQNK